MDETPFGRPRPASSFEMYSWFFMRISGVLLLFLVLGHFTLMHLSIGVENLSYRVVVERFATPFWRLYDLTMLFLAVLHGGNGLRILVDDFVQRDLLRAVSLSLLYLLSFLFLLVGASILLTFQPGV
jgi:succinate dehydrogenase / fumarate reductase membrane anchor subunit